MYGPMQYDVYRFMVTPSPEALSFIHSQRVARLATADASGQPHIVPVCFVYDGERFFSAIDQKPKKSPPLGLKRIRNILNNKKVALVLDRYREQWDQLAYLMIEGNAEIIESGTQHERAIGLLREKYSQYANMSFTLAPVIEITPHKFIQWGAVGSQQTSEEGL